MTKSLLLFGIMSLVVGNALAQGAAKLVPSHVKDEHRRCYENSDCTVAQNSCCGGLAVNKKFQNLYKFEFDREVCAATSCLEMKTICYEQKCDVEMPKRR